MALLMPAMNGASLPADTDFPRLGISLQGIDEVMTILSLLNPSLDPWTATQDMDCTTFVRSFIIPLTAAHLRSVCEEFASQGRHDLVGPANVFVSHARAQGFHDTISAVQNYELTLAAVQVRQAPGHTAETGPAPAHYYWIDLFGVNQHSPLAKDAVWMRSTLHNNIAAIGRVVLVMDYAEHKTGYHLRSSAKFLPLTRSWCLWEVVGASRSNVDLQVQFDSLTQAEIRHDLSDSGGACLAGVIGSIDLRSAVAWVERERLEILSAATELGILRLNAVAQASILDGIQRMVAEPYAARVRAVAASGGAPAAWIAEWARVARSLRGLWWQFDQRARSLGVPIHARRRWLQGPWR